MKITNIAVFVLGDPKPEHAVDMERIDALAFVRIQTDEGITGLSEIFTVPPGVARASATRSCRFCTGDFAGTATNAGI